MAPPGASHLSAVHQAGRLIIGCRPHGRLVRDTVHGENLKRDVEFFG
jgi:hypothetical protein